MADLSPAHAQEHPSRVGSKRRELFVEGRGETLVKHFHQRILNSFDA